MRKFNTIDEKEGEAAVQVIAKTATGKGLLSGYVGTKPYGGPQCMALEAEWSKTFGCKYSIAVNSATSGLLAACMAIELQHGDEIIVSPYTMSATAAAPKLLGAKIVFADIEDETFCLDPLEVANAITPKTKAVIVTNLFGHPAKLYELRQLCDEQGIYLIEDNAQAIFAKESIAYAGTVGHIGVFSLNVHKMLQTGEGGVCVTNSPELSRKLREAMNHGEVRGGIIGLNLRMTEITAAMAREQLKKAPEIMKGRIEIAKHISQYVKFFKLPIRAPIVRDNCVSSYYCWAGLLTKDWSELGVPGFKPEDRPDTSNFKVGYLRPLYELPALKQSISLPVVEGVERRIILVEICSISPEQEEIAKMVQDFGKTL